MKYFFLIVSCIVVQTQYTFSQSQELQQKAFDSVFYYTYMNIAAENPEQALKVADSLYEKSTNTIQKIRSLMLISDMYFRKSNRDSTVYYALEADKIASDAGILMWRARIYGVLSTQYRKNGLFKQGYKFLDKALEFGEKIAQIEVSKQIQGQIYQEKGFYAQEENDFELAIRYFKTSDTILQSLSDSPQKSTFRAQSEERIAANFLKLQLIDSAKHHYNNALELESRASQAETIIKGFIYSGLGQISLINDDEKHAFEFLSKALDVALNSNLQELNTEVFLAMARYYKQVGDIENYTYYKEKYLDIINSKSKREREFADKVVAKTDKKLEEAIFSRDAVVMTMAGILVVVIGFYFYRRRRIKGALIVQKPFEEIKTSNDDYTDGGEISREYMSKDTSDRILAELETLEQHDFYLNSDVSLSVLASTLNVNSRYVSYVINKYKGLGFNSYVNEIRVRRSIADLENSPELRGYKIAYLAEKYGFSSHSKYTAAFKAITGITPSLYITRLQRSATRDSKQQLS